MLLLIQDQVDILHGIKGGWTMRSEIMNALLLWEVANQRTTTEKWIGNTEDGSLFPRGRETLDIQGHELQDNEAPTTRNMAIQKLTYIGRK